MISKARNALAAIFMAITSWFEPNASKDTDTCIRETEALCLSERPDPADRHEEAEFPSPEPQAITRQPFVPHPGMRMPRRRHNDWVTRVVLDMYAHRRAAARKRNNILLHFLASQAK